MSPGTIPLADIHPGKPRSHTGTGRLYVLLLAAAAIWGALYASLADLSWWLTYTVLDLPYGRPASTGVRYVLFTLPKMLLLLTLVVFAMGVVRTFFTPERVRALLGARRNPVEYGLAALLGVATPFCSCSAVPLFIAFISAGIPLGVTFSFLIAAPMVNEVAAVLLLGMFGFKVAALYVGAGMSLAIGAGALMDALGMERHIEPWVRDAKAQPAGMQSPRLDWEGRVRAGLQAVREIVGKVWPYLVAGIMAGAVIHVFVPSGLFTAGFAGCAECMKGQAAHPGAMHALPEVFGRGHWWSIPAVVLLGVPIYASPVGVAPVAQALIEKGAAPGTALAFMMAVVGLSLPEIIILRKVLKPRLIALFVAVLTIGIIAVGYLFNALL